jgi:hypothetical protein
LALPVAATVAFHELIQYAHPTVGRAGVIILTAPHRLPFSVGPPLHLA